VFDLDPGEGVQWGFVVDTAFRLRDRLAAEGDDCWPKTTGGKGLHVMVPIKPETSRDVAHNYTRDIAQQLSATARDCYVTSATVARAGRLFIDYLRNGRGTTAIGAYSPRARPGFPVAAPVTWRQIEQGMRSDAFSIRLPPSRTAQGKLHEQYWRPRAGIGRRERGERLSGSKSATPFPQRGHYRQDRRLRRRPCMI
jgi:bifunctional non-homologous end joining protein LigD